MVLSMDRWVNKVAIVTGASSGIGAAISAALVENGVIVVGLARRSERIDQLSQQLTGKKGKLYSFKADVSKEQDVLKAFEWTTKTLGPVHVLVNNAGKGVTAHLTEAKTEDLKSVFDLNVLGLSIATREAVKIMKANNIDGHIVHINSVLGHYLLDIPKINVYPATKFAVTALTETLRQELNHLGLKIKVTSLSPGLVESEMTTLNPSLPTERLEYMKSLPIIKPEDIADGLVYVLSTPPHVQVHELTIRPVGER